MAEREQRVMDTFVDLADTLASDYDVVEFLSLLVERCVDILEVTTGGVLLEVPDQRLALVAATSEEMKVLEDAEVRYEEGPCMDAYRRGEQVTVEDLRGWRERWPNVVPHAIEIGLVAVYAFPLRVRDNRIGALNLYRDRPGAFNEDDVRLAQAFADVAAIGIVQQRTVSDAERRADQLQSALESRLLIEQAKGMLAERVGSTLDEAFEGLRSHARSHSRPLREVCRDVLERGLIPD